MNIISAIPSVDVNVKIENGIMFGTHRIEDIKKEFYQLLATTTDPNVVCTFSKFEIIIKVTKIHPFQLLSWFKVLSSSEYQQQITLNARKRRVAGDSDSEDETSPNAAAICRDIYKRRMNLKAQE